MNQVQRIMLLFGYFFLIELLQASQRVMDSKPTNKNNRFVGNEDVYAQIHNKDPFAKIGYSRIGDKNFILASELAEKEFSKPSEIKSNATDTLAGLAFRPIVDNEPFEVAAARRSEGLPLGENNEQNREVSMVAESRSAESSGVDLDSNPIVSSSLEENSQPVRFHNKMTAPLQDYVQELSRVYFNVAPVVPELMTISVLEFINQVSELSINYGQTHQQFTPEQVASYSGYSWKKIGGVDSNVQNLYMGLKFLQDFYGRYRDLNFRDPDIARNMAKVKAKLPHVPEKLLATYILEAKDSFEGLKNNNVRFSEYLEQQLLSGNRLKINIKDLTDLDKLYLMMDAVEKIRTHPANQGYLAAEKSLDLRDISKIGVADRLISMAGVAPENLRNFEKMPTKPEAIDAALSANYPSLGKLKNNLNNRAAFEQLQLDFDQLNLDIEALHQKRKELINDKDLFNRLSLIYESALALKREMDSVIETVVAQENKLKNQRLQEQVEIERKERAQQEKIEKEQKIDRQAQAIIDEILQEGYTPEDLNAVVEQAISKLKAASENGQLKILLSQLKESLYEEKVEDTKKNKKAKEKKELVLKDFKDQDIAKIITELQKHSENQVVKMVFEKLQQLQLRVKNRDAFIDKFLQDPSMKGSLSVANKKIKSLQNDLQTRLQVDSGKDSVVTQEDIDNFNKYGADDPITDTTTVVQLLEKYNTISQELNNRYEQTRGFKIKENAKKTQESIEKREFLQAFKSAGSTTEHSLGLVWDHTFQRAWDKLSDTQQNFVMGILITGGLSLATKLADVVFDIENSDLSRAGKNKLYSPAIKAVLKDQADKMIADQIGVSQSTVSTGNYQAIAMEAALNKAILELDPDDTTGYTYNSSINSPGYEDNLTRFKREHAKVFVDQEPINMYSSSNYYD